ncbi:Arc family DNA-binding protein [Xenorhabdus sp. XENO-10]|uniref:Arc family DNA-binding protein n=1 Tax=Xenorhabdus yunnanensis TaxID=3025878 RepID=A0ABT5LIV7_9GAMM|nr:Arc family DNA-binding protein [Xenorhabdus yunnanensis]MDC9591038.1 Arc family DNA-binding protein [Xenorhabdus yunnanensis]
MSSRPYKNPQVNLRLPAELKEKVNDLADINGRSANAEMVAAIEYWVNMNHAVPENELPALAQRLARVEAQLDKLIKK